MTRTIVAMSADHADNFIVSLRPPPMHKMGGY
jgi:hypothetical protein